MASALEKSWAYAFAGLTAIIGLGSFALLGQFLSKGGLGLLDMELGWRATLAWDAALCFVFFLQHSGMIREPFRRWLGKKVPEHYHGAIYTLASSAALGLLAVCWQPTHLTVLVPPEPVQRFLRVLGLLSLAGFAWCFYALRNFDAFGTAAILSRFRGEQPGTAPLTIRGPYRWVRHPLYFFAIGLIWACPALTLDRLAFNVLFTAWIVVGSKLEERDLAARYGDVYRAYQRTVPMLLPCRLPHFLPRPDVGAPGPGIPKRG
jgi:methanethiol S-methyltransferase